ncbi:Ubiquitin-activating enzyme, putative [Hondaea fermentalgiana]|uniref:E1 ubiquitin-activating enzyme n=1 Tax=Hondaea fermentalgiana TaxID=2315210 RepID=A0A2R5G3P0_9STRA|nr:Ubiquitin-activating enzyme, putative [Hondaea fermentalgiana]|eukprot:GBG25630.1 Ubiquitin-activating enzyme, putative [Hondaea fermentalgiana]
MSGAKNALADLEGDAYAMDRYSRQIGAYGVEAMSKLIKMKVLIVGLRGVGVEIAKNLILAGPGAVTVADSNEVEMRDLGTNFFLTEEHVGKTTRAKACAPQLQALNRLVDVKAHNGAITKDLVRAHSAIVLCEPTREEALKWNSYARLHNVAFYATGVHGLFGYAFADLGSEFTIKDRSGENTVSRIIDEIDVEATGTPGEMLVHLLPPPDGQRHNMEDNDHEGWVTFDEVEGPLGQILNNKGPFRAHHYQKERVDAKTGKTIKVFDAFTLRVVVDPKGKATLPAYSRGGGQLLQNKVPVTESHRPLDQNIEQPIAPGDYSLMFTDGAKFGRAEQLHVALQGLWEWQDQEGHWPKPNDVNDIDAVIETAVKRNEDLLSKLKAAMEEDDHDGHPPVLALEETDEEVIKMAIQHADCSFQPLCAFFGGVVAQEVVKISGKFTPLQQWVHLDCFEVLPEKFTDPPIEVSAADRAPCGSRYDDLIAIIGKPLHDELLRKSTFMVGCGALGCELLKNFALLGVACDPDGAGTITVTDNDRIEVSNLSRQFLFREHNVGQPKSAAAGEAVADMNPAVNIVAKQDLVAPDTEHIFDDDFWEAQDFITNALDNVKARMYVDSQCVFYNKPLLESGTLGTKCNSQTIVPKLTCSYADGPKDEAGDAIPMCTLRNFPSTIEHVAEWARARFEDQFTTAATEASNFCKSPDEWLDALRAKTVDIKESGKRLSSIEMEMKPLRSIVHVLSQAASPDLCFATCVKESYMLFHSLFRDPIVSLIRTYPEDATDRKGNPFWSGTKRFPRVLDFDAEDETHLGFITAASIIFAVNYGLQPADQPLPADHFWRDPEHVKKIVATFKPPPITEEKVDMSGGGEEEEDNEGMDVDDDAAIREFESLLEELGELSDKTDDISVEPAEFEKDDDSNGHIDWISAAANLRAINYRIKTAPRHKIKLIAGKIIPALATTTAAVTGLVMIEMLKVVQPGKQLEAYKDSSNNLGINAYFFSEPSPPEKAQDEYDPIEMAEVKCVPSGFTKWDRTIIRSSKGSLTVSEFVDAFHAETGVTCTDIMHPQANRPGVQGSGKFIWAATTFDKTLRAAFAARADMPLEEVILEVHGEEALPSNRKYTRLEVSCENDEGDTVKVPEVVYYFA